MCKTQSPVNYLICLHKKSSRLFLLPQNLCTSQVQEKSIIYLDKQNLWVLFRSGPSKAKNEPELDINFCMIAPTICIIVSERYVHKLFKSDFIFENMLRPVKKMQVLVK